MANACVRESVRTRGMGHACRHLSRNVHNFTWMCVFSIACALRWGVAFVGEFIYWALLTPSWENIFKYQRYTGKGNTSKSLVVKKAKIWLIHVFCKILDIHPVSVNFWQKT